jgi:hypothetical protein
MDEDMQKAALASELTRCKSYAEQSMLEQE